MVSLGLVLGDSTAVVAVREQVRRLLRSATGSARRLPPILILGDTGTGKGLLASTIHRSSARAAGPFVDVNCSAIPETLLEAELFGFERGAFTDARQAKAGLFQAANGGTMFLDEVGLPPLAMQAKLLKVIEERSVRRLGSTRSEPLDVPSSRPRARMCRRRCKRGDSGRISITGWPSSRSRCRRCTRADGMSSCWRSTSWLASARTMGCR
jgi:transcriptional regulator with GAF, ATPase, and Fis domain